MKSIIGLNRRQFVYGLYLSIFGRLFLPTEFVEAKSATKSGLVATSQVGAGSSSSLGVTAPESDGSSEYGNISRKANMTDMERLKHDLLLGYDRALPPVLDHRHKVDVEVDMTYRQVLDLNEKSQVLKSLIWYRQYWTDVHMKWEPSDYNGIKKLSIPAGSVWRPDITVYEEVGSRDLNPRLPFVVLRHTGQILYSEPTILETTCKVNTAFFPFDSQKCELTFVSWTQSVKHIDLRSQRESAELKGEIKDHFIATGEWVLDNFAVSKQIATYNTIAQDPTNSSESDDFVNANTTSSNNATTFKYTTQSYTTDKQIKAQDDEVPVNDNEKTFALKSWEKMYTSIPATHKTTEKNVGKEITEQMYAEVRFSLIIRRNSSLYMQSMLFPSILLTTVALMGFYLPPDSGERVGLQITILLTFMVFLLAVGEMFPASTGPYIGIYFVLSMAQLGVNIFLTIIVLHLHFKPCIRDKSTWKAERPQWYSIGGLVYEGESMIPVRTRRVLQFFAKYFNVADPGVAWMCPISEKENVERGLRSSHECSVAEDSAECESMVKPSCEKTELSNGEKELPNTDASKDSVEVEAESGSPPSENKLDPKVAVVASKFMKRRKSPSAVSVDEKPTKPVSPTKKGEERKSNASRTSREVQKIISGFRLHVKDTVHDIRKRKEKEEDEEFEESLEKEQEEWKSVARAVDKLFFRFYVFLMVISYMGLAGVAINGNFTIDTEI